MAASLSDGEESLTLDSTSVEQDSAEEQEAAYRAALESAVRSLGQREHGQRELERKLLGKGHDRLLVSRVMDYLLEHDLQSDARFAESFVRSRTQRCYGPVKIRQELARRGVSEREMEDLLTASSEYWMSVAENGLAKKFSQPPEDRQSWATQARFLARRGFPSDLIYRVLGPQSD